MPAHLVVNANQARPWMKVIFSDEEGKPVDPPSGAKITFNSDHDLLVITPNENDHTQGDIMFGNMANDAMISAVVTVKISEASDVNGNAYEDITIRANLYPPTPASISFSQDVNQPSQPIG
jgi:hypothetical protein